MATILEQTQPFCDQHHKGIFTYQSPCVCVCVCVGGGACVCMCIYVSVCKGGGEHVYFYLPSADLMENTLASFKFTVAIAVKLSDC